MELKKDYLFCNRKRYAMINLKGVGWVFYFNFYWKIQSTLIIFALA